MPVRHSKYMCKQVFFCWCSHLNGHRVWFHKITKINVTCIRSSNLHSSSSSYLAYPLLWATTATHRCTHPPSPRTGGPADTLSNSDDSESHLRFVKNTHTFSWNIEAVHPVGWGHARWLCGTSKMITAINHGWYRTLSRWLRPPLSHYSARRFNLK